MAKEQVHVVERMGTQGDQSLREGTDEGTGREIMGKGIIEITNSDKEGAKDLCVRGTEPPKEERNIF